MTTTNQAQSVKAVYSGGILRLLEPVDLPEGVEVRVQVETLPKEQILEAPLEVQFLYPTRPQPPESLERLTGLIEVGGDALADTEALYDADWD